MDIATILGLLVGMVLISGSIVVGGGAEAFVHVPSIMISIGGCLSATLIAFPVKNVLGLIGVVKKCFLVKLPTPQEEIQRMTELATIARRDGVLALEKQLPDIKDPFLVRGLEMVIDGTPKEHLEEIMSIELNYIQERHSIGKKILESMGASAPAFGMIGTLIGLVQMLRTLDDPSKIGAGMAVALLTTFYGALFANLFCIPLAGKLDARSKEEILLRELMITGLVALAEEQSPRSIAGKLKAFLAPKAREIRVAEAA